MILDSRLSFGEDFDVAQVAGTYLFTNQIDLGLARDVGNGKPLYLVLVCTGGDDGIITGGSAGTIQFDLVSDDSASIHATTRSVHLLTKEYVTDDATPNEIEKGDIFFVGAIPTDGNEPYERFLGLQAIVATTTTTEGTVSAYLTFDAPAKWKSYADAAN